MKMHKTLMATLFSAGVLAMGRYRGYRLTELVRFKAFLKADK